MNQKAFLPIIIVLIVAGLLAVVVGGIWYWQKSKAPAQQACTQEAKICPDGTGVGRTGPNCEFAACPGETPTVTSTINILSPNGGESLIEGNTYDITWKSSEVVKVNITAASGGKDLGGIVFGADAKLGKYSWKISTGFISGFGITKSDLMKIRIYNAENYNIYDENDNYFSIVAASQDQTAEWQTYRNEEYGFEIKYPPNYEAGVWPWPRSGSITPTGIDIHEISDSPSCVLSICLNACVSIERSPNYYLTQGYQRTEITIAGYPAVKLISPKGDEVIYLIVNKSNFFFPISYLTKGGEKNKCEALYNQILSTFKFISQ